MSGAFGAPGVGWGGLLGSLGIGDALSALGLGKLGFDVATMGPSALIGAE